MTYFVDRMPIGGLKKTADGYMTLTARVARGGNVQNYLGSELGHPDKEILRVYRPKDEVFKKSSITSYAGVPVTLGHPSNGKVTADSWKAVAVGEVGDEVLRDGDFIRVPMILRDAAAIKMVENDIKELSMGYDVNLEMEAGVTDSGEAYDAVMKDFKMNHVAIVPVGRGGPELRIGDEAVHWGASPVTDAEKGKSMTDIKLQTVVVGDKAYQTTDEGAAAIVVLRTMLADAEAKHAKDLAAKDVELATKDAAIAETKAKVLSDEALDKRIQDRSELIARAKSIAPNLATAGVADAAIRKAALVAKLGDAAVAGKPDAYIDAYFDIVADAAKGAGATDPLRQVVLTNPVGDAGAADAAYNQMRQANADAWKTKGVN